MLSGNNLTININNTFAEKDTNLSKLELDKQWLL